MSSSDLHSDVPTALSFSDFRDEEIVGFFANDQRTFFPMVASENGFGGQRLVGKVHPPSVPKPTAAFRTAFIEKQREESSILHRPPTPTIPLPLENPSVELPLGKSARPLGIIASDGRKPTTNNGRAAKVLIDPLAARSAKTKEPKSSYAIKLGIQVDQIDGNISTLGEKSATHTDDELAKLVERWPKLSSAVKEFIGTLVAEPDA